MDKAAILTKFLSGKYLRPLNVLLAVVVLYLLADFVWRLAELAREAPLPVAAQAGSTISNVSSAQSYNVQSLLSVPLFGVKPAGVESQAVASENVKVSALKISVLGLVAGGGDGGVAVLRYGNKTRAYAVGEKIEVPGDVRLLAVRGDHILIENNRRREKIELDKRPSLSGVSSSTAERGADATEVDIHRPEIRELIGDPRQIVQESPLKLVRFFSLSPVTEGGQLVGYALGPGRDKRLFELLNVEAGDILLSVNGQALADVSPPELLKMMENTNSFELLVKRGDAILTRRLTL